MAAPKWTDDRTEELTNFVGDESPVSQATVAEAADQLNTSTRSISSKLRKMGYEVESASVASTKAFSDEQEETLRTFVEDNSGSFTYAEIAETFEDGNFSAKQIQGKILSMELTEHVRKAEKKETVKTYTDEEEETFINLVNDGKFAEEIAEVLGKSVNSVRGKALSLLRTGEIQNIPKQRDVQEKVDPLTALGDLSSMSVSEIAESIEKTERGVKTMLTRRGLTCSDYDGKSRKEKAAAS